MYDILREHFIANPDKVLEDGFTAFDRLWLDLKFFADPGAILDQVFMGHIRKVVAEYEQAQKKAPAGR